MKSDNFVPPRVVHTPLAPPRKSVPGEVIYLDLWREWATIRPLEWHAIFCTTGPVRQRAASVAASFMTFMGCNCGRAFTDEAERLATSRVFPSRERAFIAAWAIENQRIYHVNRGLRTSEFMLAAEHPLEHNFNHGVIRSLVPAVTQEDNDIIESMAIWWSTGPAGVMRSIAVPMIEAANRKLASDMFKPLRTEK